MSSVDKLSKMIDLEIEQDYENRAVIGGLDRVLVWWPLQVASEYDLPAQKAAIQHVIERIKAYGTLEKQARAGTISEIQGKLTEIQATGSPEVRPPVQTGSQETAQVERQKAQPIRSAPANRNRQGLSSSVTSIAGVGPTQAKRLKRLGAETIGDLLYLFPRRHDDYTQLKPIGKLSYGEQVTVIGTIRSTKMRKTRGGAAIVNTIVADGSGVIQATWFNQPYLAEQFKRGRQIVLSGTVDEHLGRFVMTSPTWEPLEPDLVHTGRMVPVYPLTQGLNARWLRKIMKRTVDYWASRFPDYLLDRMVERLGLMPLGQAIAQMHFPDDEQSLARARKRLSFDEFFVLQLGVLRQRQQWQSQPGIPIQVDRPRLKEFLAGLPYELTGAQQKALGDILTDLSSDRPMSRLLQGDVGSGKTVVAMVAMYLVALAGFQTTIIAPTEILAEQHAKTAEPLLAGRGLNVCLLTGSASKAEKQAIYDELAAGKIQVLIGTHAVIQQGVQFKNLGLAIVDEQHRFGVRQRGTLRGKGHSPHMLVMSATPIPRTLALTAYGDLDLSVIDEMPPGRQPVRTRAFMPSERERAYRFLHSQAEKGHQAYIICPLVEESDKIEARAAVQEYDRLQKSIFPDLRLGLLHGRLKPKEKERVMVQFSQHELDVLVSTSVIEVGIDVPNATVMMIEGANRFGLAQLHQFRGRVGRGKHESYCILVADKQDEASQDRLQAIEETQDGFKLAEKDLEMRGPGDFFGTRQSGLPELKLASLGDTLVLEIARREAQALFAIDPKLSHPDHQSIVRKLDEFWMVEGDPS